MSITANSIPLRGIHERINNMFRNLYNKLGQQIKHKGQLAHGDVVYTNEDQRSGIGVIGLKKDKGRALLAFRDYNVISSEGSYELKYDKDGWKWKMDAPWGIGVEVV